MFLVLFSQLLYCMNVRMKRTAEIYILIKIRSTYALAHTFTHKSSFRRTLYLYLCFNFHLILSDGVSASCNTFMMMRLHNSRLELH